MATSDALTSTNPIDGVAGRAHVAVDQAAGKAAPVIERAQAAAHRTIDRVAETAQPAAQWAAESGHRLAARSNALADSCTGYVRDRPFTALAGALAIGYFAGRLMR